MPCQNISLESLKLFRSCFSLNNEIYTHLEILDCFRELSFLIFLLRNLKTFTVCGFFSARRSYIVLGNHCFHKVDRLKTTDSKTMEWPSSFLRYSLEIHSTAKPLRRSIIQHRDRYPTYKRNNQSDISTLSGPVFSECQSFILSFVFHSESLKVKIVENIAL